MQSAIFGKQYLFARFCAICIGNLLWHVGVCHAEFLHDLMCCNICLLLCRCCAMHYVLSFFRNFRGFVICRACCCLCTVLCASLLVHLFIGCYVSLSFGSC